MCLKLFDKTNLFRVFEKKKLAIFICVKNFLIKANTTIIPVCPSLCF